MPEQPPMPLAATADAALAKPSEAGDMLRMAIEKGVPVESLERLQAMYERAQDRAAAAAFNEAMSAFHADCPVIGKSSTGNVTTRSGGSYSYKYASLDEIARTVRPYLAKHGLSCSWDSVAEAKGLTVTCTIRHIGGHSERSTFAVPTDNPSGMNDQQKAGSALTYARRYSLTSALGITTGEPDDDGAGASAAVSGPITDAQLAEIEALTSKLDADSFGKFMAWVGAESLAEINARDYTRAVTMLRKKVGAA